MRVIHAMLLPALLGAAPVPSQAQPAKPMPEAAAAAAADPYASPRCVHRWAAALRTHGVGAPASSPYYAAAVHKQVVYDDQGNFLQARYLGDRTRIGGTPYVLRNSAAVQGVAVYTYVKG